MATTDAAMTVEQIRAVFDTVHAPADDHPGEGLRDRKKRRARQHISNVATALFLAEGYDNVTVSRIAAASEVSEQTVFNYFPTKESMFFDRSETMAQALADAIRQPDRPLADSVARALSEGVPVRRWDGLSDSDALRLMRRFWEVAESTPDLRAAMSNDLYSFTEIVAAALAERTRADRDDPEVRLTAFVVAGLASTMIRGTFTHVAAAPSIAALERAVNGDLERALRFATPLFDAFDRGAWSKV
jgi:AcrR family transcriptional regulator